MGSPEDQPPIVRVTRFGDDDYPMALVSLEAPPHILYWVGARWPPRERAVAIVGSRAASPYGLEVASALAADLARAGVSVVSGMARGIDAAAHEGALSAGGETVAVLAAPPQTAYPADVAFLHAHILRGGAACAEYPRGTALRPGLFVRRNRLVSGLSLGVVVVEAGPRGGALSTARRAREQRRFVAAVPGDVTRENALGTLALLRGGAVPVGDAGHVLALVERAERERGPARPDREREGDDAERVRRMLAEGPQSPDEIARRLSWKVERACATLVTLEMAGAVARISGGRYELPRGGSG